MQPWIDVPDVAALAADGAGDRADFACVMVQALAERAEGRGALPDLLGLQRADLAGLVARHFPGTRLPDLEVERGPVGKDQESLELLIRWRGRPAGEESLWLAKIIARRAMERRHLWEDLGLPSRAALGALMARHFPALVAANSQGMRWKKFFYRQICSDTAFALCLSPSCDDCLERADCFPPKELH